VIDAEAFPGAGELYLESGGGLSAATPSELESAPVRSLDGRGTRQLNDVGHHLHRASAGGNELV
jgi:hypothetical protein